MIIINPARQTVTMMVGSVTSLKGIKKPGQKIIHSLCSSLPSEPIRDNRIIKLLKFQKCWPWFPSTWGGCRGCQRCGRPSTQSKSAGRNMGSGGSGGSSCPHHHLKSHLTPLHAEWMAENHLLFRRYQIDGEKKDRTVRDFWRSLDWLMSFSEGERNRKVLDRGGCLIGIIPFYLARFLKGKFN